MKRFMLTVALTCILSVSALAGEMPTCGVAATSPPPAVTTDPGETDIPPGETSPGVIQGPGLLTTIIITIITWP